MVQFGMPKTFQDGPIQSLQLFQFQEKINYVYEIYKQHAQYYLDQENTGRVIDFG